MILSYTFDKFVDAILQRKKIHTLRRDPKKRWRQGMSIQHWRGSPRNTRGKIKPYQFKTDQCISVQEIFIQRMPIIKGVETGLAIRIDGGDATQEQIRELVANDFLTLEEFREYFVPEKNPVWKGRCIHYTDKVYHT